MKNKQVMTNRVRNPIRTENQRGAFINEVFNTVKQASRRFPYPNSPDEDAWTAKYNEYDNALSLLKQLTAKEFMALFANSMNSDSAEIYRSEETTELIMKHGINEPLGERALEILSEVDELGSNTWRLAGGDNSYGIWSDFYAYFIAIAEYLEKLSGKPNPVNNFRIIKGIDDFWESE